MLNLEQAIDHIASLPEDSPRQSAKSLAIELAKTVDLGCVTYDELQNRFFGHPTIISLRLACGIVKTPEKIAELMVRQALRIFLENKGGDRNFCESGDINVTWLDPCVGAGVFPVAIINYYLSMKETVGIADLPFITINDTSVLGVFLSLCAIRLTIESSGQRLEHYIGSGRLNITVADALERCSEAPGLLSERSIVDIVVANPPYVRATRLGKEYKEFLKQSYPTAYDGSADLYTYFIASAISSLDKNGVLVFISPAGFVRAKSGSAIRNFVSRNAVLDLFIDLDETPVFENAGVHSAIYALRKGNNQTALIRYGHVSDINKLEELCDVDGSLGSASVETSASQGWSFHASCETKTHYKSRFESCVSLKDLGINVFSGIRPGLSDAFILNDECLQRFSPEVREAWISKIVLPADILKWCGAKRLHHILMLTRDCEPPPKEVFEWLGPFKSKLSARSEAKSGEDWYRLRPCSYYDKMRCKKIVFPDLSATARFSLSEQNILISDGGYFIDSDDVLLLGVLNSEFAKQYFVNRCSSVGSLSSRGRFRFKKVFVQDFPVPKYLFSQSDLTSSLRDLAGEIVLHGETEKRLEQLEYLVNRVYKEHK